MSRSKHRKLGPAIIVGVLVVAFFALATLAGIATSPLGVTQPTIFAGLGSCPLGFQAGNGSIPAR